MKYLRVREQFYQKEADSNLLGPCISELQSQKELAAIKGDMVSSLSKLSEKLFLKGEAVLSDGYVMLKVQQKLIDVFKLLKFFDDKWSLESEL
jgi:hypothetical protein